MPTFRYDLRLPLSAVISLDNGSVRLCAVENAATTVEIRPADPASPSDVAAARRARVGLVQRDLRVTALHEGTAAAHGAVAIEINLPPGSDAQVRALAADVHGSGALGECRIENGIGNVRLDEARGLHLSSVLGEVSAGRIAGDVEAVDCGSLAVRRVEGETRVERSVGGTRVGEALGKIRIRALNGDIRVGLAHGPADVRTGVGGIRIDEARSGPLALRAESGLIEVGLPGAGRSRLDLSAPAGSIYQALDFLSETSAARASTEDVVELTARAEAGDILVRGPAFDADLPWL